MLTDVVTDLSEPTSIFDFIFVKNPNNIPDDTPIFTSEETTMTFGELSILIRKCAYNLKQKFDIQKGDVIAIRADPHIDYVMMVHGITCAGGSVALVSNSLLDTPNTICDDLETVKPKMFITDHEGRDIALAAASKAGIPTTRILSIGDTDIEGLKSVKNELFIGKTLAEPCTYTKEELEHLAIIILYTSGTTGRKKAVIFTPKMMLYTLSANQSLKTQKQSILAYRHFHMSSVCIPELHESIIGGNHIYIEHAKTNEELCQAIEKYKITKITGAPYVLIRMLKEPTTKNYNLSSLTTFRSTGSVQHQKIIQDASELLGFRVENKYGCTEAHGCIETSPECSAMGAVGRLNPNYGFRLVDENCNDVKRGEPGELLLKGATVSIGYYNNPELTAKAFTEDGYYRTGDVFKCDSDGVFWFLSRSKNLIKYRICHIYPIEIETIVLKHPKVSDCGVIGVLSQQVFEELPRAYITLVDEKDYEHKDDIAKDILEFTNKQLHEMKQIRGGVIVKKAFERTASGKIIYSALKEEAEKDQYH